MRRQSVILTAFFALFLATFAPIRAQESASTDENAGIMLAASNLAYTRISDLIRGQYDGYTLTSESSATNPAELYTYILKDVADDSTGDVWLFSGMLLAYGKRTSSSSAAAWLEFPLTATLYRLSNGAWALCSSNVAFGLPNNMTSFNNTYGVTYDEGANYYEQLVAAARRSSELRGTTFNETSLYNYINYATWDTDNGGVNNLAEWVRGTKIDDWKDDAPNNADCKCGACCSCECKCGQWSGAECGKTSNDCACHPKEPDCTCADYCCACECKCEKCADGTHSAHQNGSDSCDGTTGDTIGFVGCDCHKTTEEKECECAKYCCKHTCKCEKCGDGEHSAHENGSATCDNTDGESGWLAIKPTIRKIRTKKNANALNTVVFTLALVKSAVAANTPRTVTACRRATARPKIPVALATKRPTTKKNVLALIIVVTILAPVNDALRFPLKNTPLIKTARRPVPVQRVAAVAPAIRRPTTKRKNSTRRNSRISKSLRRKNAKSFCPALLKATRTVLAAP